MNNFMWGAAFLINKDKSITMIMIILFPNKSAGVCVCERDDVLSHNFTGVELSLCEKLLIPLNVHVIVVSVSWQHQIDIPPSKRPSTAHVFSCSGEDPGNSQRWRLILKATVHVISFSSQEFASVLKPSVWITPTRDVNTHRVGPN